MRQHRLPSTQPQKVTLGLTAPGTPDSSQSPLYSRVHRPLCRVLMLLSLIAVLLPVAGCDSATVAIGEDNLILRKLRTGTHELIAASDLAQLRKEAELGRSVGRYQNFSKGLFTWRLDTATGDICLLLAPEAEWKKKAVSTQGCQ